MPILDLRDAAPLYMPPAPSPALKPASLRTFGDPGTVPAGLLNGGGGGIGGFAAAKVDRLVRDFMARNMSADQELFGDNQRLRARGKDLAKNSPYIRKFRGMLAQNVVGQHGIQLQAKVTGVNGKPTAQSTAINQRIEQRWKRWCRKGRCTADGKMSFAALQRLAIKTWGTEGEALTKLVYGRGFNDSGIALQMLDNDQLDDTLMMQGQNGTTIRMGVEVDQYLRPQAYHLFNRHPFDQFAGSRERKRVEAKYIVHTADWERPGQTRGYTPMANVMLTVKGHYGWTESTLLAARMCAAKPFAIERDLPTDGSFVSEDDEPEEGAGPAAQETMSFNPGEGYNLDPGEHLQFFDPRFPTQTFADFSNAMLREMASGLLVSYPSLANNLEGVNFSSIRAGLVDERDCWRVIQFWFIESYLEPIFSAWLESELLIGELRDLVTVLSADQREQMVWRPRGWAWVDPVKDADAAILRNGNLYSTRAEELGELGRDFEETVEECAREQAFIESMQEKYGLKNPLGFSTDIAGDQGGKGVAAGEEDEAEEVEGDKDGGSGAGGKASGGKAQQGKGGKGK